MSLMTVRTPQAGEVRQTASESLGSLAYRSPQLIATAFSKALAFYGLIQDDIQCSSADPTAFPSTFPLLCTPYPKADALLVGTMSPAKPRFIPTTGGSWPHKVWWATPRLWPGCLPFCLLLVPQPWSQPGPLLQVITHSPGS